MQTKRNSKAKIDQMLGRKGRQRKPAAPNPEPTTGETADKPRQRIESNETRAVYSLERIAGSFERIAFAVETIAEANSAAVTLAETFANVAMAEIKIGNLKH